MKHHILKLKPHLTTISLALIAALFLSFRILANLLSPAASTLASDLSVENILNAVNHERSNRNLVTLNPNSALAGAADFKAHDMISRKYFAHVDPDGNYIWPKIVSLGYAPYTMLGENLAIEFYSTDALMQAWMNSPTHRANILQDGFRDTGAGLAFGSTQNGEYGTSIANTFGTLVPKKHEATQSASSSTLLQASNNPAPTQTPVKKSAPTPKKITPAKPAPKPAPKVIVPKPAPAKTTKTADTPPAPQTISAEPVQTTETPAQNPLPLLPRGITEIFPLTNHVEGAKSEPSFQTAQNVKPPAEVTPPTLTPTYQESSQSQTNPYQQYRLWGIIVAVGALGLLALEVKRYIRENQHIPRHKWNTIIMLIITLFVTALAYVI